MLDLNHLQNYREDSRIEAKQATGGLPESIWETYSAFANAEGGVILLGVAEAPDKTLYAMDLQDPQWLLEDFWRGIQDPNLVSVNILKPEHVREHLVDGKRIIAITVPAVPASLGPVYIFQDERWTAFRRRGEGDFRCTQEELEAMYRRREKSQTLRAGLKTYLDTHFRPRVFEKTASYTLQADCAPMAARPLMGKAPSRPGLREWLQKTDAGFSETLLKLIDKSGKKDSEIYAKANLSRQHFSKIRNNPNYRPTKPTALALAIALELDLAQTKDFIGRAGYALTNSSEFDLIVMYFIEQGCYDLGVINEALYEYDQSLLGA